MNRLSQCRWLSLGLFTLILQAAIVFVLIPEAGSRLDGSYNVDAVSGDGYDQIAANLADGNGYRLYPETARTLMREPGYPVLLAGIYKTFGRSVRLVQSVNLILALATAFLMMGIASQLSTSRLLILAAPLVFLFHPGTLIAESRVGVEGLFTLFLTLFVLTMYRAIKSNEWRDYAVSGGVLGLTVLVRSTPILFPAILLGYLLVFKRSDGARAAILRNIAVMVVAMYLVVSPWIIRNYSLTRKFVPTASVLGVAAQTGLYISLHHSAGTIQGGNGAARERNRLAKELGYPFKEGFFQYFYSTTDELRFSNYLFKQAVGEYERRPLLFVRTLGTNLFSFWFGGKTPESVAINLVVELPFLVLGLIGVVLFVRNGQFQSLGPMLLLVVYIVGVSVPITAEARYSVPLIPFLSILACTAFAAFLGEPSSARNKLGEAAARDEGGSGDNRREPVAPACTGGPSKNWSRKQASIGLLNPDGNGKQ